MEDERHALAEYLASIRDPRLERTKRHKLIDILIASRIVEKEQIMYWR